MSGTPGFEARPIDVPCGAPPGFAPDPGWPRRRVPGEANLRWRPEEPRGVAAWPSGSGRTPCDANRIRHQAAAHRHNPRRVAPVGFPYRPARSVAADQVNAACYQAAPWLAFREPCGRRARERVLASRSPFVPAGRGPTESVDASTDTRMQLPSRPVPRKDRDRRLAALRLEAVKPRRTRAARGVPPKRHAPPDGPARSHRTSRFAVPLPSEPAQGWDRTSATEAGSAPEGASPDRGVSLMYEPVRAAAVHRAPTRRPDPLERACAPDAEAPVA